MGSLGAVRARIANACIAAGRDPRAVTLIAVTKTYPAGDVATLAALGVLDIGESRDQEASAKVAEAAELLRSGAGDRPPPELRWHFVGRLQSRKARSVATYAHAVHSVDRPELVEQLAAGVTRAGRDRPRRLHPGEPGRRPVARRSRRRRRRGTRGRDRGPITELRLRGVMAVAPMAADPRAAFAELATVSARLRAAHPQAVAISAGMTADLEEAIAHGSTHVRVGSALLGRRTQVFG